MLFSSYVVLHKSAYCSVTGRVESDAMQTVPAQKFWESKVPRSTNMFKWQMSNSDFLEICDKDLNNDIESIPQDAAGWLHSIRTRKAERVLSFWGLD
jgi:hypothetical protein